MENPMNTTRMIFLVLACFVCAYHTRRLQVASTLAFAPGSSPLSASLGHAVSLSKPSPIPRMQLGDMLKNLVGGTAGDDGGVDISASVAALVDKAPTWETLHATLDKALTDDERSFRKELESGRAERACALASRRLFDLPEGEEPVVTLFRDQAAWCPYCEKVWLVLEEKRIPYEVKKINMNCYGTKPDWFWEMAPSGGIPVAKIDSRVIRESDDIIRFLEQKFTERPLLPSEGDPIGDRVDSLLVLERQLFGTWFRWLNGMMQGDSSAMESLLKQVDKELGVAGGPYFLGEELSLVDCMYAPFLERMAASLPYYKGLAIRRNEKYPRIEEWFQAMESRPSYRHIQSDFYTHVHDLPPQIGGCVQNADGEKYAATIDGSDGSWSLPLPEDDGSLLEPLTGLGQSADAARREAAERLLANHDAVVRFAARGLSGPGSPPVSARFSDPNAKPNEQALPIVDAALRHVVHALLDGIDVADAQLSSGIDPQGAAATLGYLRDRISVPRDMSYPAARQLRAHLNHIIDKIRAQS